MKSDKELIQEYLEKHGPTLCPPGCAEGYDPTAIWDFYLIDTEIAEDLEFEQKSKLAQTRVKGRYWSRRRVEKWL
jgi:hypothetical protein